MASRTLGRVLLGLLVALAASCATRPPPPVETGQLFLWEVARPDGKGGVAHLLGTVHLSQDALHFDPAVEHALAEAEWLVLEIDPSEMDPAVMQRVAGEIGFFQDGRTLDQVVGPETWALLATHTARLGMPAEGFRTFEPWFALLTLQMMALEKQGFAPEQGVERGLVGQADDLGKPTRGLETAAGQLGAFDTLPLDFQSRMLREFLQESASGGAGSAGEGVAILIDAWRKGDAARIESEIFDQLERDPTLAPYFENLYFRRNREMAGQIGDFIDTGGRWFVAVGAAHMVGARGLPSLLAEQGYRVERVPKTVR
ncbi:MAG: TraB/GumN family protein [Myxococcota bacterium]